MAGPIGLILQVHDREQNDLLELSEVILPPAHASYSTK